LFACAQAFLRMQHQPSHPPLSPLRQPPEPTFADPLPTLHLQFHHLRALFADPSLSLAAAGAEEGEGVFRQPTFRQWRPLGRRGRRRSISSTDFPPVAAAGAQKKSHNGNPPPTALGNLIEPRTREPELQALVSIILPPYPTILFHL